MWNDRAGSDPGPLHSRLRITPPATKVVVLKIQVGADGAVRKVNVVRGADPQTDATAVKHAWGMRFQPARRQGNGQTVESTIEWKYRFEMASAPTK
jgi:TonB family protein